MIQRTEHVFCPKCKSFALECESCDMPEWIGDDVIGAEEYYVYSSCGYEFGVATTYTLSGFYFRGKDEDDIDYEITKEE